MWYVFFKWVFNPRDTTSKRKAQQKNLESHSSNEIGLNKLSECRAERIKEDSREKWRVTIGKGGNSLIAAVLDHSTSFWIRVYLCTSNSENSDFSIISI